MIKKQNTRRHADKTRKTIMQAATELFAKHGFSGTSMQKVADKARVNQALLYHHFDNKQTLWKYVKESIFTESFETNENIPNPETGLENVLSFYIDQRIKLLVNNPTLIRILRWQRLESDKHELLSHAKDSPFGLVGTLEKMQELNIVKPELDPKLLTTWILGSIHAVSETPTHLFSYESEQLKAYQKMLIDQFIAILKAD